MGYATPAAMREWVGVPDSAEDALLDAALAAASSWVDDWCGQSFAVASSATARVFQAHNARVLHLPPPSRIPTITDLAVKTDDNEDGVYETTWTITTDFVLQPDAEYVGATQRPWRTVAAVGGRTFPRSSYGRPLVQITARWGWSATPAPVAQATKILAAQLWKSKDAPFGVAGFGDMGIIRIRENPTVASLLAPFVEHARLA